MKVLNTRRFRRSLGLLAAVVLATPVIAASLGGPAGAAWPGTNGKIAFKSEHDAIWTMNADGTDRTQLTDGLPASCGEGGEGDEEPTWSPDGTKLLFTRTTESGGQDVWVMNGDGSGQTQLTHFGTPLGDTCDYPGGTFAENPSWSPDGSEIVFTAQGNPDASATAVEPNEGLWLMNADGSNQQRWIDSPICDDSEARFSPDGTRLVYLTDGCQNSDNNGMWVVDLPSLVKHKLLDGACYENYDWAPDSSKIVFTDDCEGTQVAVIDPDGSNFVQLTSGGSNEHPGFSPDGTQIVFASNRNEGDHIWVMDADGSNQAQIPTGNMVDNGQPDWQPVPAPTPPVTPVTPVTPAQPEPAAVLVVAPRFTG